jgi:hypothetical protein
MTPEQVNERLDTEFRSIVTKDHFDIVIGRLENKIDARFNSVEAKLNGMDAKFNNQRILLLGILLGVIAQIVNAWIMHLK